MKHSRLLYSDEDIARARKRVVEDAGAKQVLDDILKKAETWVNRADEWLEKVIVPASVPRAFNAHHKGCPVHGTEYFKHGNYSFIFSLDRPWKIICPVGGEEYPSNDFGAFFDSGMQDQSLLTGPYADDGWGWHEPGEPKKWWFVAYYNHWAWMREIIPGILALARAYVLTDDLRYAHKAGLLLHRVADEYPAMDHNKQSRYATEFSPTYQGRILNCIWECFAGSDLAEAYDHVFHGIAQATALHNRLGKSPADICAHIEKNLMDEIVSGVYKGQIRGNYGMHQHTLMTATLVRQAGDRDEVLDYLLKTVGSPHGYTYEGIDLLMHNLVHRDGVSVTENAPGYAWLWVERTVKVAEMMKKLGVNLYARHPKILQMLLHPLRETVIGKFSPTLGDSASVTEGHVILPRWCAEIGYREYGDPHMLSHLQALDRQATGEKASLTFEDLFREPLDLPSKPAPPRRATVYDPFDGAYNHGGYGLALLRSGKTHPRGAALWYGPSIGHGHRDKLMVEVYALGRKILPDLGYPQFTDDHPERDAWVKNTISHATVVVDAKMQTAAAKGNLHLFGATDGVQVAEASAETNYPGMVSMYRRTLGLIDVSETDAYAVDIFRVAGGAQHDYSLHGPYGEVDVKGIALSDPATGTLAGPDVPYTFLHDDEVLQKPNAQGFNRYKGSGFSYLKHPQRATASKPWQATYRVKEVDGSPTPDSLTLYRLPVQEETVFAADGIPPFKSVNPPVLKYLISRREGQALSSTFVSLFVPHKGASFVQSARLLQVKGDAVALAVKRENETDIIVSSMDGSSQCEIEGRLVFEGRFGVLTLDNTGTPVRASLFGGGQMRKNGAGLALPGDLVGTVTDIDPAHRTAKVTIRNPEALPANLSDLIFREMLVQVGNRMCGLRICDAHPAPGGLRLGFGSQDMQVAHFPVEIGPSGTWHTRAKLPLAELGYYDGAYATTDDGRIGFRVRTIKSDGAVHMNGAPDGLTEGWMRVFEVGPGDEIRISAIGHWHRS